MNYDILQWSEASHVFKKSVIRRLPHKKSLLEAFWIGYWNNLHVEVTVWVGWCKMFQKFQLFEVIDLIYVILPKTQNYSVASAESFNQYLVWIHLFLKYNWGCKCEDLTRFQQAIFMQNIVQIILKTGPYLECVLYRFIGMGVPKNVPQKTGD